MDDIFRSILRIHPEPNRYVDDRAVHALLTDRPADYLEHVLGVLERIADGRAEVERPAKQIFTDPSTGGDFRVMPCVVRDQDRTTKTVKIIGTNMVGRRVPDQVTVGRAYRLDPDENFITHTFDGCLLSSARTGACGVMALRALAPGTERIAVVGAGRVGYYTGVFAATSPSLREIVYVDRDPSRARAVARALSKGPADRCTVRAAETLPRDVDAVVLATISPEPVLRPEDVAARTIVSLGAAIATQRELDSSWAGAADVYMDTADSLEVGDLKAWVEEGVLDPAGVRDLADVLRNGAGNAGRRPRVFVSTGSALFDNLTIDYLVRRGDAARRIPAERRNARRAARPRTDALAPQ